MLARPDAEDCADESFRSDPAPPPRTEGFPVHGGHHRVVPHADPIPVVAAPGKVEMEDIVASSRHVAQRNLYVIDPPTPIPTEPLIRAIPTAPYTGLSPVWVPNYTNSAVTRDVVFSTTGLGTGRVSFLLPGSVATQIPDLPTACGQQPAQGSVAVITVPKGLVSSKVAVGATNQLELADRARIENYLGEHAGIANTGTLLTMVGAWAQVGTITGTETTGATLTPSVVSSWKMPSLGASQGNVYLEPNQTRTLTPGTYGWISVKSRATLTLMPGEYVIDGLDALEPDGRLRAETANGTVIIYAKTKWTNRGVIEDVAGEGSRILVVLLGTGQALVESPFRGTLIAPYGSLKLATCGGNWHIGSFYAKNVLVEADAKVRHVNFEGWAWVGVCTPLIQAEKTKATSLGLDPTKLYPVGTEEDQVAIPVPSNSRVRLGLRYESPGGMLNTANRFRVAMMKDGSILGGSIYVLGN
jgi:hypothetical protein